MLRPKPYIEKIAKSIHGGPDRAELRKKGLNAAGIIDFSVSTNPFRLPRAVHASLHGASIHQYPDSDARDFINALVEKTGCVAENLVAGSGSTELIRSAAAAYVDRDDIVVTLEPTYSEYELACRLHSAQVKRFKLKAAHDFRFDVNVFLDYARQYRPKAIFICNPNNPTGGYIDREPFEKILSTFRSTLVILDEAYLAFTQNTWDSLQLLNYNNLLIIRSLTKDYGLAGLRLGYAVASRDIVAAIKKVLPPWNVNSMAQQAGIAALTNNGYLERQTARIQAGKQHLENQFRKIGFKVVPSRTNFFLVRVGNAASFRDKLLRIGFLVRDCASFGLPEYIRVAARGISDCRRLIIAVREIGS